MKILTLNTHSLSEKNQKDKIKYTAQFISSHDIDIVALQEANQSIIKRKVEKPYNYQGQAKLKKDNYVLSLVSELLTLGKNYYWYWLPIKIGFGRFEEGVAFLSKKPIEDVKEVLLTQSDEFTNWRKRMALGIQVDNTWYYTTHMGWWDDEVEPFINQWNILHHTCNHEDVYIMGDFNAPDVLENQSYDQVLKDGWLDCYKMCKHPIGKDSAKGKIVGWSKSSLQSMRLDYIFTNKQRNIKHFEVVFDGKKYKEVSDHFGIYMEVE